METSQPSVRSLGRHVPRATGVFAGMVAALMLRPELIGGAVFDAVLMQWVKTCSKTP